MLRALLILLLSLLPVGCAVPRTVGAVPRAIDALADDAPPAEFGRPGYVRVAAKVGAWAGGLLGGALSIVLLPVTWPLSQLAGDGLGERGAGDLIWSPAIGGAATGHFLLGAPIDGLDYVCRRAWTEPTPPAAEFATVPAAATGK